MTLLINFQEKTHINGGKRKLLLNSFIKCIMFLIWFIIFIESISIYNAYIKQIKSILCMYLCVRKRILDVYASVKIS